MNFDQAVNIEDLHRIAKRKLPRIIFDYIEGGVENERGLARNEAAFHKHRLLPRYLVDVSKRDQSTTVFGRTYSSPFGISPTGGVGLYRREGEVMLAEAAAAANIPYIMSGGSNASMEDALRVAPNNVWFQLYAAKDPAITDALIGRARDGGAGALVLTVDVPVHPKRERNYRNGFARVRGGGVLESLKLKPSILLEAMPTPPGSSSICGSAGRRRSVIGRRTPPMARAPRTSSLSAAVRPRPRRRPGATSSATGACFRGRSSSKAFSTRPTRFAPPRSGSTASSYPTMAAASSIRPLLRSRLCRRSRRR